MSLSCVPGKQAKFGVRRKPKRIAMKDGISDGKSECHGGILVMDFLTHVFLFGAHSIDQWEQTVLRQTCVVMWS
jgi:hypothetical protein